MTQTKNETRIKEVSDELDIIAQIKDTNITKEKKAELLNILNQYYERIAIEDIEGV